MDTRDFIIPLMKWWWLIVLAVVVSTITSAVVAFQQPAQYEAKATLIIGSVFEDPNPTNTQLATSETLATTYANIAGREFIQINTAAALGVERIPQYIARTVPRTNLLEIVVTDRDPSTAARVANEVANQLILTSPTSAQSGDPERVAFIDTQLDNLQIEITETQAEIDVKYDVLSTLTSALEIQNAQQSITALQSKLSSLQNYFSSLLASTTNEAINTLQVIEPAVPPRRPVGPNSVLLAVTSALIGFVFSAGGAYLLEYLDNTVKTPDDIMRLTDLPMLSVITSFKVEGKDDKELEHSRLITYREPRAPVSEAYRKLRTGIQFASIDGPSHSSILITSTNPSEGKSVTAANLAVVMAQAGYSVLLIDADLRRPTQHTIFELPNNRGLTSLLLKIHANSPNGELDSLISTFVYPSPVEGLAVMTSGPIPPNPSELLGSVKMRNTIDALTGKYDYVVIDSPPVMAVTDAVVLATQVDSVVMVTEAGRTQRTPLKTSVKQLLDVKANLLGVVVNRLSARADNYYYYYYQNSYYEEGGLNAGKPRTGQRNGQKPSFLRGLLHRKDKKETPIGE